jgi:hypothetical protein
MSAFPEAPPNLKSIQPYLKIAVEHDQRDIVGELGLGGELRSFLMNIRLAGDS